MEMKYQGKYPVKENGLLLALCLGYVRGAQTNLEPKWTATMED